MEIDLQTADRLVTYAETVLEATVHHHRAPPPPDLPLLRENYGAFATLKRGGTLRGCIGSFAGGDRLQVVLPRVIRDAALHDPRFSPVEPEELPSLNLTLSLLSHDRPVNGVEEVRLGYDGIILALRNRRAVFLPEVATEQGWEIETTMEALCRKAGLPPSRSGSGSLPAPAGRQAARPGA